MAFRNLRFDPTATMVVGRRGLFVNGAALAPGAALPSSIDKRKQRTLYDSGRIVSVKPEEVVTEKASKPLLARLPVHTEEKSKDKGAK